MGVGGVWEGFATLFTFQVSTVSIEVMEHLK